MTITPRQILARALTALAVCTTVTVAMVHPGAAHAGSAPMLLDRNTGIVLTRPRIVNLFWDSMWDADNPFTRARINAFSADLVGASHYLDAAGQYGIAGGSFFGSVSPSWPCTPAHPAGTVSSVDIFSWVTCEVLTPGTGVPYPDITFNGVANTLYVVYLPRGTNISDGLAGTTLPAFTLFGHTYGPFPLGLGTCSGYAAYHFVSFGGTNTFAYAVVPAQCAGTLSALTTLASHEIVEAATDPYPTASWVNRSLSLIGQLRSGEAADICAAGPTPTLNIDGFTYARYWSNMIGRCVA